MRAAFAVAALAGSAFAAPRYGQGQPEEVQNVHVIVETVVHTVYVTEGYEVPMPTSSPAPVYEAPTVPTMVYKEPAKPSSVYEEPAKPSSVYVAPVVPAPTPKTPAPATPANSGYMATVDTWRAKLGLKPLIHDSKLESNAMDTVVSSNGQMVHKLNPGTYGQVLAPGSEADFEHVFVGGWLCEIPTLPGLDGVCQKQSNGFVYNGQTGHAEILTSDNYSKIACAFYSGIWCCDLA